MNADAPLVPASHVVSTKLSEDEAVLLHLETKRYFSLNETGTRIWDLLEEGMAPSAVRSALEAEYAGDPSEIRALVDHFLDELKREGLVREGARRAG